MKFYQNPRGGSRSFMCGRTDGVTNLMNLLAFFIYSTNAP
jgi:hypothetical protein